MPTVSIVMPVYRAERTMAASLMSLADQTYRDFDVWIVDSSPSDHCRAIVEKTLPGAHYLRSEQRMWPHAALNRGVNNSTGELVAFLDPDVYAAPDWLEKMVAAHHGRGGPIVAGIGCYGGHWLHAGFHLAKFDKWLDGGSPREVEEAPTASLLIPRATFLELGGFMEGSFHADTDLSWRLRDAGGRIWLEPEAAVQHHHIQGMKGFLSERFQRGGGYALLRTARFDPGLLQIGIWSFLSVMPFRLCSQTFRVATNSVRAGYVVDLLRSAPVLVAGLEAWLLGESVVYLRSIIHTNG